MNYPYLLAVIGSMLVCIHYFKLSNFFAGLNTDICIFTVIGQHCGDVRPLDITQIHILTVNGVHLLDRIDANNAFVTELANVGCLAWRQREHIMSLGTSYDRNDKLLEFLTRRSVEDYQKFINVIAREQPHLVHLLLPEGGQDVLFHVWYNFYISKSTSNLLKNT